MTNTNKDIWVELTNINGVLSEHGIHLDHLEASGEPAKSIYFPNEDGDVEVESESLTELVSVFVPYRLIKAFVELVEARKATK